MCLVLLLERFVHPQVVLRELIDEHFPAYNYRIQLELLAIVTATLVKYRQYHQENLPHLYQYLLPLLVSTRRELRHGTMECCTMMCAYFNAYKPLTLPIIEANPAIVSLLASVERLSSEASSALRFRLQRNLLPALTDEGNITPGLVCDAATMHDPDAAFILAESTTKVSTASRTNRNEKVR